MKRRFYAEDTTVPVSKSRGEIDDLLRRHGCGQIRWTDDFAAGRIVLEFVWTREGGDQFAARYVVSLPDDTELRKRARHATTRAFLPAKYEKIRSAVGRAEMRGLALLLRAKLNAVETGITTAEDEFLSALISPNGQTVAEILVPQMAQLNSRSPALLLTGGDR